MVSKISIVGVDDSVCPQDLVDISQTFKFVEWGINLCPSQEQKPEWPSAEWLEELLTYSKYLKLRGILHDRWQRDIIDGTLSFKIEKPELWKALDYVQIDITNNNKNIIKVLTTCTDKTCSIENRYGCILCAKKIVVKTKYIPSFDANILLTKNYLFYFRKYCGYSISEDDLELLGTETKDSFWVSIDGFRLNDNVTLDLSKVESFLNKAKDFVSIRK